MGIMERTLAYVNFVLLAVIVIRQTIWFTIGV
jgi:hypothetical protein